MGFRFLTTLFVLITCFFFGSQTRALGADHMLLVYFEDYRPFSWKDQDGKMKGILVDVLTEVLENRLGISVEHRGYPWARAQEMVKFGEADGFCTVPTDERRQYTVISEEPIIYNTVTVFTWKDNPKIEALKAVREIKDLKDFTHGQYSGSGWARAKLKGMNVLWVSSLSQVLEMLAAKRIEVVAESSYVMRCRIKSMRLENRVVEVPTAVVDTNGFNLCIGKESPHKSIIAQFDRMMMRARKDGTHKRILDRYR